jgi:hypothetical protein
MKTRKRKKRTGSSLPTAIICAVSVCLLSAAIPARAGEQGPSRQYALVAGTVFQESGLSLRGAEILLVPNQQDAKAYKLKKSEAISDARGEFAFRVPAQPARYTIKVKRKGFVAQEKPVEVKGDERIDVNFQLEPAS